VTSARADYEDPTPHDPDSARCLVIIGGYTDIQAVLESVRDKAARRIIMSPVLGDFVELRHLDIGARPDTSARPEEAAERGEAVSRIAREFTRPRPGAGRTYFALVIADHSAKAVERVLADCAVDPVLASMPLRCRGFASEDDRVPAADPASGAHPMADIVVSATGRWRQDDLAAQMQRYADELLRDFATGPPGLSPGQLDALRADSEQELVQTERTAAPEAAGRSAEPGRPTEPGRPARAAQAPEPDALRPPPVPARREPGGQPPARVPAADPKPARPSRSWVRAAMRWTARTAWRGVVLLARGTWVLAKWIARTAIRRRPASEWPPPARAGEGETVRYGVLYLLIAGEGSGEQASWPHGRRVLRQVDQLMAATEGINYWVRAARNIESVASGRPRPAGQVSRRDLRRSPGHRDLARALSIIRVVLGRDLASLEASAGSVARPVIVFYTLNAPPADLVTIELYDELTKAATVVWVVTERTEGLMSPRFAVSGTHLIIDHQDVAGELARLLRRVTGEDLA
jgi:hypothetical protein